MIKIIVKRTISSWTASLQSYLTAARRLSLAALCGLLLVSGTLAQEGRPEQRPTPDEPSAEASTTQKAPDPNEAVTPVPQAHQSGLRGKPNGTVDGDIIFSSPGQFLYPRDIRLSDNFGVLRLYGADSLTSSPAGAAIQLFGNNVAPFNGQLYLDSGAHNNAALIFRTARTGGTITERMRIRADGRVSIGAASPSSSATLRVVSNGSRDGVIGEAINGTGVGQFAQAIISSEIKQNRFTIKTNKPQVKVSWQVTGIRQDAYAEAHRIPVEEEKCGEERRHIPAPGSVRPAAREERRARAAANIDAATGTRGEQRNNCRQANSNGPAVRLRRMAR